ncbi:MAG: hypothetical protein IT532_01080 [Burkholderiales bacterium]|nr:hypothetical protein [Burkholderiales bacterium]
MNAIRTVVTALTFAALSSVAFASETSAARDFGRDTVTAQGKSVAPAYATTRHADVAHGRQGGLTADAKKEILENAKGGVHADLVNRVGRS